MRSILVAERHRRERLENLFGRKRLPGNDVGLQPVSPHHSRRFGAAANQRGPPRRVEHLGKPPEAFGLPEDRRRPGAGLEDDDVEAAGRQPVHEGCRFGLPGDLAYRRGGNRPSTHAADELGEFRAEARLQQPDARPLEGGHASL